MKSLTRLAALLPALLLTIPLTAGAPPKMPIPTADPLAATRSALEAQIQQNSQIYKRLTSIQFQLDALEKQKQQALTDLTAGEAREEALRYSLGGK